MGDVLSDVWCVWGQNVHRCWYSAFGISWLFFFHITHERHTPCSVLPKVFWAPVLRTSGSWNLPVRMEGSLVRNFNTYYVLLIHVFDGCNNRFDSCDHFNLVCCCLCPVLISDKRSCWKISQSLKPIWLDVEMLVPLSEKINQCCRDACQISEQLEDSKRFSEKLRQDLCDIESAQRPVQCSAN